MKMFYIETDELTRLPRKLRYVYSEQDNGSVSFLKVVDPSTKEEILMSEMKKTMYPDTLINVATAYLRDYEKIYFEDKVD